MVLLSTDASFIHHIRDFQSRIPYESESVDIKISIPTLYTDKQINVPALPISADAKHLCSIYCTCNLTIPCRISGSFSSFFRLGFSIAFLIRSSFRFMISSKRRYFDDVKFGLGRLIDWLPYLSGKSGPSLTSNLNDKWRTIVFHCLRA